MKLSHFLPTAKLPCRSQEYSLSVFVAVMLSDWAQAFSYNLFIVHCTHYFRCAWIVVLDLVEMAQEVAALQPDTNQAIMEGRLLVVGGLLVAREEA